MSKAFGSLPIRFKLLILILVPLAALLFFSMLAVYAKQSTVAEMDNVAELASLSVDIGNAAHELQKERGMSSGFLASKGEKFGAELVAQRAASDRSVNQLRKHLQDFPAGRFSPELKANVEKAARSLDEIGGKRRDVDVKALKPGEAIAFYSSTITTLLDVNSSVLRTSANPDVLRSIAAYDALLWSKEYAGRERATLNGAFAQNAFSPELFRGWLTVLSAQAERLAVFKAFATPEQIAFHNQKVSGASVDDVQRMRQLAQDNARADALGGDAGAWFRASTGRIDLMREVEGSLASDLMALTARLGQEAHRAMYAYLAMAVGSLLATLTIGGLVFTAIATPLRHAVGFAQAVGSGNLDSPLTVSQHDEIGALCDAMKSMVSNLKIKIAEANEQSALAAQETEMARQAKTEADEARAQAERARREGMLLAAQRIEGVVARLTQASENIAAQVVQSSRGAQIQKDRVTETATAMEEMNATVLEVARNAGHASESSHDAQDMARGGAGLVHRMVQVIGEVRQQALGLKENMDVLGQSATNIAQVMGVINDIADQTNLLALNAAIEAARAGEAGRGFAVVADEVRKLAEKTMTATKEVSAAIKGIHDSTQSNARSVEQTVSSIEQATGLADDSGRSLAQIVDRVEQSNDQVRAIAAAAEEQSAASDEINRSLSDINTISTETADAMEQSASAVAELSRQAEELQRLVSEMAAEGRAA